MPATSKSQQRLFGMIHAVQKGEMKSPSGKIRSMAKKISPTSVDHFAATKHKKLPERRKQASLLTRLKSAAGVDWSWLKRPLARWAGSSQLSRQAPNAFHDVINNPDIARVSMSAGKPSIEYGAHMMKDKAPLIDRLVNRGVTPRTMGLGAAGAATAAGAGGMMANRIDNSAQHLGTTAAQALQQPLPQAAPAAPKTPGLLQRWGNNLAAGDPRTLALTAGIPAGALLLHKLLKNRQKKEEQGSGYYQKAGSYLMLKIASNRVEAQIRANTNALLIKAAAIIHKLGRPLTRQSLIKVAALIARKQANMQAGYADASQESTNLDGSGMGMESGLGPTSGMTGMDGGLMAEPMAQTAAQPPAQLAAQPPMAGPQSFTGTPAQGLGFMSQSTGY